MNDLKTILELETLNPSQRKAVKLVESPVLVLAGPGSGKTRVLTFRIAQILESTLDHNFRILGLTFTHDASDEMQNRLIELVPQYMDKMFLGTYHSFCADVLRQHGSHIGIKPNFNIYSQDMDLKKVLSDSIRKNHIETNLNQDKLLPTIKLLKSFLIFPEESENVFENKNQGKIISEVYSAYENRLKYLNALDFDSLILNTYKLFKKYPAFIKRYRKVYKHICIDEFQDTNFAQYELIKLLCGKTYQNLFVVADDDQIIYQWNGASHQRITKFITDYSPKIIQLPVNYRCPQDIVDIANKLISHNFFRQKNKLPSQSASPEFNQDNIRLLHFSNLKTEAKDISYEINNKFEKLEDLVILARNRKILNEFQIALREVGINAVISQRKDDFESTPMIWILSALKLVNDKNNKDVLEALCGTFYQLTDVKTNPKEVIIQSQTSNLGYLQNWLELSFTRTDDPNVKKILNVTMEYLGHQKEYDKFSDLAINYFSDSILHKEPDDPSIEKFADFEEEKIVWYELKRGIKNSLGKNATLEAFLQELQMHSKEHVPKNSVILMTIHGSKGKEFDHVYLVGLVEDLLPSFQSISKGHESPEMEEERRNCFVAITRAKKTLTLSYSNNYYGWRKKPSRFLYEMGLLDKNEPNC
ncbi:hypothetical protein BK007_02085 [Methanobacterium subterraneum]|uniref:DNA 3'-5' helicase n=1 Tax=Methanobacterium subterraneum TaxID=59277 RepID=A0A2H4VA03_9EURY|nr:ATP-dependent helicase [Methanobacterium subterraneum]AUB54927.1 hypothetical protein BK007_02085 [Methanobacterium subterraneum]